MTLHHSFTTQDFKRQCMYCSTSFDEIKWDNIHVGTRLYKHSNCSCGKVIMVPVNFLGSGHDNWDGKNSWKTSSMIKVPKTKKKIKTLESKIKILSEKSYP